MTQLRLKDFFRLQNNNVSGGSASPIDFTLNDREEPDRTDNISFHSFTVYKSLDGKLPKQSGSGFFPTADTLSMASDFKPRQRKISDFNERMLVSVDKENSTLPSVSPLNERAVSAITQENPTSTFNNPNGVNSSLVNQLGSLVAGSQPAVQTAQPVNLTNAFFAQPSQVQPQSGRVPFGQVFGLKTVQNQPALLKPKEQKLDDYFKSICVVDKDRDARDGNYTLGKRQPFAGDENITGPGKQANSKPIKKIKPLDNFVVRIKRNTTANCSLYVTFFLCPPELCFGNRVDFMPLY